jgi:hypothetical protein
LKAYGGFAEETLLPSRAAGQLAIYLELALGGWLLSGLWPAVARWVAAGCFTLLFGVSVVNTLTGKASCGCLGPVSAAPWAMAAFDLTVVALLVALRPPPPPVRAVPRAVAGICLLAALCAAWPTGGQSPNGRAGSGRLTAVPAPVELGVTRRGQKVDAALSISNDSDEVIRVAVIESSCPCVSIVLDRQRIAPGEAVAGRVTLDLGVEPDFVGDLSAGVIGRDEDHRVLFRLKVNVTVTE